MIYQNLGVLFFLAVCMISTWWLMVRLVNYSMGTKKLKEIVERIYESPLVAAIYRVGVLFTLAYLVRGAFERFV